MNNTDNKNTNISDQKSKLFDNIWKIANELRGKVDSWDFKSYVLGFLFYRYISENICDFFNQSEWEAGNKDFDYAKLNDKEIEQSHIDDAVNTKGFFIKPSQLFSNIYMNRSNIWKILMKKFQKFLMKLKNLHWIKKVKIT